MNALKRTLKMPLWLLGLWLGELALAFGLGANVRGQARNAVGPFAHLDPGHQLHAILELLRASPSLVSGFLNGAIAAAIIAALGWTLLAPALIARADGKPTSQIGAIWWSRLPPLIVTSLWHLLLRVAVFAILALVVGNLPRGIGIAFGLLGAIVCGLALDLARVHVVLEDAPGLTPKTAFAGFVLALRNPAWLVPYGLLWISQLCVSLGIAHLGAIGLGGSGTIWLARGLALAATVLGVWRLAWVVCAPRHPLLPEPQANSAARDT